jgi:hypothetical protein
MGLFRRKAVTEPEPIDTVAAALSHATMRLDGTVAVVGSVAHEERLRSLLAGRQVASLMAVLDPEVFNASGAGSVAVHVDGHMVGHLPRDAAERYRAAIVATVEEFGLASVAAEVHAGSPPSIQLQA